MDAAAAADFLVAIVNWVTKGPLHPPSPFRRWGLQDVGGWFLVAQFGGLVTGALVATVSGKPLQTATVPLLFLATTGLWLGYGVGPLITSRVRGRGPLADYGAELRLVDGWALVIGAATQLVLLPVLYWPLLRWVIKDDPGEVARSLTDRVNTPTDVVLLTLMVVVIAPAVEELFYRGLLLSALRFHFGDWTSVLLTSGLFALIHLQPVSLPGLFLFGLIAAGLRIRSGRLGPSWMFHVGFNAATLIVLLKPWEYS